MCKIRNDVPCIIFAVLFFRSYFFGLVCGFDGQFVELSWLQEEEEDENKDCELSGRENGMNC